MNPPPVTKFAVPLIAFTGLATCGKTTAALSLSSASSPVLRLAFADPLKAMIAVLTQEEDKNARPPELCGKSVREAYQSLGTDWGRNMVGEDIWLVAARKRFVRQLKLVEEGIISGVVVDDCRFDNEAKLIKELGGVVVRIERPGLVAMKHASETGIDDRLVDHVIHNLSGVQQLAEKARDVALNGIPAPMP